MRIASSPADYRSASPYLVRQAGLWCVGIGRGQPGEVPGNYKWNQETTWCKTQEAAIEQYREFHPEYIDTRESV